MQYLRMFIDETTEGSQFMALNYSLYPFRTTEANRISKMSKQFLAVFSNSPLRSELKSRRGQLYLPSFHGLSGVVASKVSTNISSGQICIYV